MIDLRYADCPYQMPRELEERMQEEISSCNSYPSGYYSELKQAIARYARVRAEQVVIGNGADEIIDLVTRCFGKRVLIPAPTFSQFELAAKRNRSQIRASDCMKNGRYEIGFSDEELMDITLVWICNPNNPTGTLIPREKIMEVLEKANGIVAVDEAYYEFSGVSVADLAGKYPNLVVVRSFSKGWGLAGLRLGYAICSEKVARELEGIRQIFSVNKVAEIAGKEVLGYSEYYRSKVQETIEIRDWFSKKAGEIGLEVLPTCTNFVLVKFKNANRIQKMLAEKGVLILRGGSDEFSCLGEEYIRFVIGTREEMERVIEALSGAVSV